jgi:hypothetical protein
MQFIELLHRKHDERVVVLIDEYDKPIIDHFDEPELAQENREVLRNIYGVLKGMDAHLRFVFLTGVSKFTKLSLFSQLNNLVDLTLWKPYAGICGFTEPEFDSLFSEHLAAYQDATAMARADKGRGENLTTVRNDVFFWYDGYTWDGATRVFNPFSLLSFFLKNQYNNYWYASGIPKFLSAALKERPQGYLDIQEAVITENLLDSHDIEKAPLVSLLFQTGFLTVKSVDEGPPANYSLGFPNNEVSQSCSQLFLAGISEDTEPFNGTFAKSMRRSLDTGTPEDFEEPLRGLFAAIPYHLHIPAEAFYQAVFLAAMQFLGFRIQGELCTATGRIDGVIQRPDKLYILEFKYIKADAKVTTDERSRLLEAAINDAFEQIETKQYADRYLGTDGQVCKVAVAVCGRGDVRVRARSG